MSDAIRCGQCRWWDHREDDEGLCEIGPSVFTGGDPTDGLNWFQPRMLRTEGCSRGSPKSGSTITVKLTEETLQPRRFEEET